MVQCEEPWYRRVRYSGGGSRCGGRRPGVRKCRGGERGRRLDRSVELARRNEGVGKEWNLLKGSKEEDLALA